MRHFALIVSSVALGFAISAFLPVGAGRGRMNGRDYLIHGASVLFAATAVLTAWLVGP